VERKLRAEGEESQLASTSDERADVLEPTRANECQRRREEREPTHLSPRAGPAVAEPDDLSPQIAPLQDVPKQVLVLGALVRRRGGRRCVRRWRGRERVGVEERDERSGGLRARLKR